MKIKAVGFDYGGVIGSKHKNGLNFSQDLARIIGVTVEEFRREYFKINHLVNTGKMVNWEEFDKILLEKLGREARLGVLTDYRKRITSEWVQMDKQMLELVGRIRARGIKVGLLSNAAKESGRKLRELGLADRFDVFMISAEEGLQKPDPKIFLSFVDRLGVGMEELVFIDDAKRSLSGAKELGYYPILYSGYNQLVKKLVELEVLEKK